MSRDSRVYSPELNTERLEDTQGRGPRTFTSWASADADKRCERKEIGPAALALKVKLEEIETHPDAKGLESVFKTAKQKQVGAIMMPAGRRFSSKRKRIVELAVKYRLAGYLPTEGVCR